MNQKVYLFSLFAFLGLTGCGVGERDIVVENCEDSIVISDCKWKGQLYTCLFKNKADTAFTGASIWKYDENGMALDIAPYRYAVGLKPGESVREKLPVTKYGKDPTAKIIYCSSNPGKY